MPSLLINDGPLHCCCCCFTQACLAEQARPPLRAINCFFPWGTEAIPRVRCSRPNGWEQKERWRRFGPTLFGVGVHPPRRGAPRQMPPLVGGGGGLVCQSVGKAVLLSDHFDGKQSRESVDLPLTCHPSPSLPSFAFRSSEVRRLLLDLNPYGGSDPLGMSPLFLKGIMQFLNKIFQMTISCNDTREKYCTAFESTHYYYFFLWSYYLQAYVRLGSFWLAYLN